MQIFETQALIDQRAQSGKAYLEFLNVPDLSMGLYALKAGATDPQSPHNEDEAYYVISGRGQIQVGDEHHAVQPGSIVYVAKHLPHKFHSITEDLQLLVFFTPAESSK